MCSHVPCAWKKEALETRRYYETPPIWSYRRLSSNMWVLGTEHRSSAKAGRTLNCSAISLDPGFIHLIYYQFIDWFIHKNYSFYISEYFACMCVHHMNTWSLRGQKCALDPCSWGWTWVCDVIGSCELNLGPLDRQRMSLNSLRHRLLTDNE